MPRYYYTCPIQALYMMKEFGVRFEIEADKEAYEFFGIEKDFIPFTNLLIGNLDSIGDLNLNLGKIYVAKESEHIFKLKEGDIVSDGELFGKLCSKSPYEARSAFSIDDEGGTRVCKDSELEIIMRDNKQFFMPEVEDANN
jgi:hypothetical protein